jgi:3-hydroxybutyryl-CoA dehydrogenase
MAVATGELIRAMNYVEDITATLRRIGIYIPGMSPEERKRLAEAVQTIAVIGAGIMGRGIAHAAAVGGYRTILEDLLPAALRKAETEIRANLDKAVKLNKVAASDADAAFRRLEYAGSVEEAAREADLVIEAVPEEMESKIEIFTLLDKICRPNTILASNTSSLSVTEIASVTYRAKKCLGMHFFNPVHKMKLLEVVRALETDEDTLATAVEVGRRMGKEVVVIKESPGFITSRINAMIGNEAFYMLQEGIASAADIDKALKLGLNHPMGPFELVDLVGLDTRLHILEYLHKTLGDKYRPAPLLVQYVKAGRLGRKSGRGVYEYPEAGRS